MKSSAEFSQQFLKKEQGRMSEHVTTVAPGAESITVVCCIEAGPLEENATRLVESLRIFGGVFKSVPIVAVTPRFGPPLSRRTLALLDRHEVQHVRFTARSGYSWNGFLNKPLALAHVEQLLNTETVCWLDSDTLILGEPELLAMAPGEDFLACISDFKNNGTSGDSDQDDPYWRAASQLVGVALESIPWVRTPMDQKTIRAYFNSGVFAYRRRKGLGEQFLKACLDILGARIGCKSSGIFFTDQVAMGLTVFRMGLRYRELPLLYNYPIGSFIPRHFISIEDLKSAKILHFHDAMWPPFWPTSLEYLQKSHPSFASWLEKKGPTRNRSPLVWKGMGKALKLWRKRQEERFANSCVAVS